MKTTRFDSFLRAFAIVPLFLGSAFAAPLPVPAAADGHAAAVAPLGAASFDLAFASAGGGTVSPASGSFAEGTVLTVTATADAGKAFSHWTGLPAGLDPLSPTLSFSVTQALSLTAHFGTLIHVSEAGDDSLDGASWETARKSLQKAYDDAASGDTILVDDGTYVLSATLLFSDAKSIRLKSRNGRDKTTLQADRKKCYSLLRFDTPFASVEGFTLANGARTTTNGGTAPGGYYITPKGGVLRNCRVTGIEGWAPGYGIVGVQKGGLVSGCLIDGNRSGRDQYGTVLLMDGRMENSVIAGNTVDARGSGLFQKGGVARNCTITGNMTSGDGAGLVSEGGLVENTIIWGNVSQSRPDEQITFAGGKFANCCFPEKKGKDSVHADPLFADPAAGDFSLRAGSPCIDAGIVSDALPATDFAGNPRVSGDSVDIGAFERDLSSLTCGFAAAVRKGLAPFEALLTPSVYGADGDGTTLSLTWEIYDDEGTLVQEVAAAKLVPQAVVLAAPGLYTVTLKVADAKGKTATATEEGFLIASPKELFVSAGNQSPVLPYASWETAAATIADAIAMAASGSTVFVKEGLYPVSAPVVLDEAIVLRGVDGAGKTFVEPSAGATDVVLCALRAEGAVVEGLTFRKSRLVQEGIAGVIQLTSAGGTLRGCRIVDNVIDNTGDAFAAICQGGGLIDGCFISGNESRYRTGGLVMTAGICQNTIFTGNGGNRAGGVLLRGGVLRNCTIAGNRETGRPNDHPANRTGAGGLQYQGGKVLNTIIWGNESTTTDASAGLPDWRNDTADESRFLNNCSSTAIGTGCVVADPLFRKAEAGDFRIRPASPCRDTGLYEDWMAFAVDFWGNPRAPRNRLVDIGAHEESTPRGMTLILR